MEAAKDSSPDLDLLWGAEAIAEAIGLESRRKVFHLLENQAIPAKKVGGRWVADRRQLRQFFLRDLP